MSSETIRKHENLMREFYEAFARGDTHIMAASYHDDATFSDPVFPKLDTPQVRAMWRMLNAKPNNLRVEFSNLKVDAQRGNVHWRSGGQKKKPPAEAIDLAISTGGDSIFDASDIYLRADCFLERDDRPLDVGLVTVFDQRFAHRAHGFGQQVGAFDDITHMPDPEIFLISTRI